MLEFVHDQYKQKKQKMEFILFFIHYLQAGQWSRLMKFEKKKCCIDTPLEYFKFINCVFLFFIYTGDITTLPAMSLQDQNHWVLLRGAGRCGDHEGWVILSVHLYINRYIIIYQYCISVLIWESEELLVADFFFTKS